MTNKVNFNVLEIENGLLIQFPGEKSPDGSRIIHEPTMHCVKDFNEMVEYLKDMFPNRLKTTLELLK